MHGHILCCIARTESNQPTISHIHATVDITTCGHSSKCTTNSRACTHVNTATEIQGACVVPSQSRIWRICTITPLHHSVFTYTPPPRCCAGICSYSKSCSCTSTSRHYDTVGGKQTSRCTIEICVWPKIKSKSW